MDFPFTLHRVIEGHVDVVVQTALRGLKVIQANQAHQDLWENEDRRGLKDLEDFPARWDHPGQMGRRDSQALLGKEDQR